MERGISHATGNESLVSAARTVVQHDFCHPSLTRDTLDTGHVTGHRDSQEETPQFTFSLPDLTRYTEDFRGFLEKDLIEMSALISLEQSGVLNWWADTGTCQRLWPLATTGDGNCLLHAASLGMWGFHDRLLTLRKTLYTFLTRSSATDAIYRRWRWQCAQQNYQSGLCLTESEWSEEWSSVLRLASPDPRQTNVNNNVTMSSGSKRRSRLSTVSEDDNPLYESLEEIHVLVLAHVLRRPIIVVSDTVLKDAYGEALAPISFGGIYLPLEVPQSECDKSPLILTYDAGHFSALVTMQSVSSLPTVIPLTDSEHSILPVQFALDPGNQIDWGRDENNPNILNTLDLTQSEKLVLLKEYLDVVQVPLPACFLDTPASGDHHLDLVSPDSLDSASLRDCEVTSQSSQDTQHSGKSRSTTKQQLQSVVKQFGSIGKTMGKKIKKNLGSITRLARTGSFKGSRSRMVSQTTRLESVRIVAGHQDHILAAMIHTQKCLPYLKEMISNYLHEARMRFDKDKEMKALQNAERRKKDPVVAQDHVDGVREGCQCRDCQPSALYGSGNSKFYVNSDTESHQTLRHMAQCPQPRSQDRSLYLANSTFYRDHGTVIPVPHNAPDPMPIVPVDPPPYQATMPPRPPVRNLRKKSTKDDSSAGSSDNDLRYKLVGLREAVMCQTKGCSFFGSFENNSYCSRCFRESQQILHAAKV